MNPYKTRIEIEKLQKNYNEQLENILKTLHNEKETSLLEVASYCKMKFPVCDGCKYWVRVPGFKDHCMFNGFPFRWIEKTSWTGERI